MSRLHKMKKGKLPKPYNPSIEHSLWKKYDFRNYTKYRYVDFLEIEEIFKKWF